MIVENSIIEKVKKHVRGILSNDLSNDITYHSIDHTEEVAASAMEIAEKQNMSEGDVEIIQIAAWFHDLGYVKGGDGHEASGARMAEQFLIKEGYALEKIRKVVGCIIATRMPQDPQNSLEKILCDADLMHLAGRDYFKKAELLHKEIEKTKACKISDRDWLKMNEEFLGKHCFFTEYAKKNYEPAVKENLKKVTEQLKSWKKKTK